MTRFTVIPWLLWAALVVLFVGIVKEAGAEPIAQAKSEGITITIYSEPCALKDQVSNLPARATWEENGKTFEGCGAGNPALGIAVFYFREDKSVAAVPIQLFERLLGV